MCLHCLELVGAVYALFPFVTLNVYDDTGLAVAGSIHCRIYLEHCSRNG